LRQNTLIYQRLIRSIWLRAASFEPAGAFGRGPNGRAAGVVRRRAPALRRRRRSVSKPVDALQSRAGALLLHLSAADPFQILLQDLVVCLFVEVERLEDP